MRFVCDKASANQLNIPYIYACTQGLKKMHENFIWQLTVFLQTPFDVIIIYISAEWERETIIVSYLINIFERNMNKCMNNI